MIKEIKGNPKVLTVHGDSESCNIFAREIHEKFGFEAYAPSVNETITV
jgi:putative mRNA 3-end processing factor